MFTTFVAGPCFIEVTNFIESSLNAANVDAGAAVTGIAVGLDWAFHFLPILCMMHLLLMYVQGRILITAMQNMASIAKTAASA